MKRFAALLVALSMLCAGALAEMSVSADGAADGVSITRTHEEIITDDQNVVMDYPVFACDDPLLAAFLQTHVTDPICEMATNAQGTVRGGYNASLAFDGLLSVEASVRVLPSEGQEEAVRLFSCLVDLNGMRMVEMAELFNEPDVVAEEVICSAAYEKALEMDALLDTITDSGMAPLPDSYYVTADALRVTYLPGTLCDQAAVIDLPWEELPLTWSPLLAGSSAPGTVAVIGGADGPTAIFIAEDAKDVPQEILTAVDVTPTPMPTVTPFPQETFDPNFALAPVITPTPMPLAGNDVIMVDVLTRGLWKPLGTEGDVYYQFTEDGKLLTVSVSSYTVKDGVLQSDALSGVLDIGSNSAFTLDTNGVLSGYVLNRQGDRVAPEEFVTPTPTPVPTPTPSPTPVPTPTPTPTPTPVPTPTPSPTPTIPPYQHALMVAPELQPQNASFEKARSLKVYGAPGENTWSAEGAMVTTDETVTIYGLEKGWVLVSYAIGDGSRGRIGYIDDKTLEDPEAVPQLNFCSLPMTLTKDAEGTDDPLRGKAPIAQFQAGDKVTLLAFMGDEWAYVQTGVDSKVCRLFIPRTALMEE